MTPRKIAHVDMDAFYASVEQRDRPHLRGKPVAVGGSAEGRGVIAAASYEARRFGVRSAMSTRRALQKCPDLVLVPTDFARYRAVSRALHGIFADYTDRVEPLSLDEAYLDLSDDRAGLGSATANARAIRRRVREELQLTCSAGVSSLKFVAKIASDVRKPDGLTVVPPDRVLAFIHPMPLRRLWGVGPATARRLEARGLKTIGQLAALSEVAALEVLGQRGMTLWRMSHGIDPREVRAERRRSSRGSERTYAQDVHDLAELLASLDEQLERLVAAVQTHGERPRTLTVKVRYGDFETVTRSKTFPAPTLDRARLGEAMRMLVARTEAGRRAVRLAGVSLSGFDAPGDGPQLWLPWSEDG